MNSLHWVDVSNDEVTLNTQKTHSLSFEVLYHRGGEVDPDSSQSRTT